VELYEILKTIQKLPGFSNVCSSTNTRREAKFSAKRTRHDGSPQKVMITITDGRRAGGDGFGCIASADNGKVTGPNAFPTVELALTLTRWSTLD
jgi:hypothetical protein